MSSLVCNITTKMKKQLGCLTDQNSMPPFNRPWRNPRAGYCRIFSEASLEAELWALLMSIPRKCRLSSHQNSIPSFTWTCHNQPAGYPSFITEACLSWCCSNLFCSYDKLAWNHENAAGLSLDENSMSPFSWTWHNPPRRLLWNLCKSQSVSWTLSFGT